MANPQILIAGAGPTGLVLALLLARHGIAFRIIDKNSGPGQASRAMVVHARTLEFYNQLGFADEFVAQGIKMEHVHVHEGGTEVAHIALGEIGQGLSPYPFVLDFPQDDHEHFLVAKLQAAGIAVEWNTALVSFTQDAAQVSAVIEHGGATEQCEFAYVCGCDGARSTVREALRLDFPGGTYERLYYVADVRIDGSRNTDLHAHIGPHTFNLMLPVRSSGMQRLIGIMPDRIGADAGAGFEDVRPDVEHLLGVQVSEVNWFSTYRVHHRVASQFRSGRCFVCGDAAHIHSPAGGQGMNTGIGDAVNLSWKLAGVLQQRADASLLDTYEAERIVFARKLVATTDRAFQAIVSQGLGGKLVRNWLVPGVLPFLSGFTMTRRAMFRTVSQIQIHYADSALSKGRAGKVSGGDRLPWVKEKIKDQIVDNFDALRSLEWQLHVYGALILEFAADAQALGLAVHTFAWNAAAAQAGLQRDAAYLIRPDGHVALALPEQESGVLRRFSQRLGLRFSS
ncbi:FAD-dependent monooxygenase [Undibacterium sp. TJN25]|uniref:FAD-dependent monooxygenase n=1 Tax=Undibacterium sp. TJN25 TaxID=3413056 RepID=UPI003BF079C4